MTITNMTGEKSNDENKAIWVIQSCTFITFKLALGKEHIFQGFPIFQWPRKYDALGNCA